MMDDCRCNRDRRRVSHRVNMGVKSREPALKYSNSDVNNDVNNLFLVYNVLTRYKRLVIRVELQTVHFEHPDEPTCKVTDRSLYKL